MAGGEGTRLRPLTCSLPKPMVPVGNRPILDHVLALLARHGFTETILTLHHRPQVIRDHVGDGSAYGLSVKYYVEDVPLGTAGSVKNVEPELRGAGTILVCSGDVLADFDLGAVVDFHRRRGAVLTIALTSVETPLEYGVVVCDKDGRVRRFVEKPSWGEVLSDQVNTGIYVMEPEVLGLIEPGRVCDFSQQLFPALLEAGKPVFGYRARGYWCDVGNLGQYLQAHVDILEGRTGLEVDGTELEERVWVGPGVEIAPGVELTGPMLIGQGTCLGAGCRIEGPVVLGREVAVGGQASIKRSVIGDHSFIGRLAEVRGATLGRGVRLQNRSSVFDGAVLADEVRVGEEAVVKPGVKVWPGRTVAPETVLGDNLVWGQTWGFGVFTEGGVKGAVNVDLRPETVARLGAVFGASLDQGAGVIVGLDPAPGPRLLRDALVSGLGLAGCTVWNAGELPAVAVRYGAAVAGVAAAVHVGRERDGDSPGDAGVPAEPGAGAGQTGENAVIRFFGPEGLDYPRSAIRRLERLFGGEDFRRAAPGRLGQVRYFPGLGEAYLAHVQERGRNLARKGLVVAGRCRHPWLEARSKEFWRGLDVTYVPVELDGEGAPASGGTDPGRPEALGRLARDLGAAFVFEVDAAGETLRLVDNLGRPLSRAQVWLVLSSATLVRGDTPLVVPSDLPRAVAERLAALGGRPVPCGASRAGLLARMHQVEKDAGPRLFSQSEMIFGGLLGVVGLLDHLADTGVTLAEIVDESPLGEWTHLRVACPWDVKGRVMRLLLEEFGPVGNQGGGGAGEGLRAEAGGGHVLVLPDPDRPAFHVYSEAATMEVAEEIAGQYARRVRKLAGLEDNTGIRRSGGQS